MTTWATHNGSASRSVEELGEWRDSLQQQLKDEGSDPRRARELTVHLTHVERRLAAAEKEAERQAKLGGVDPSDIVDKVMSNW